MLSIIVNAIKWYKYASVEFLTYVLQKFCCFLNLLQADSKIFIYSVFDFFIGFIATSPAAQLSPTELTEMRNELFNTEKSRQLSLTPRTEKIEVKHVGKTDPGVVFLMNKNISTPYSCAMRK